MNFVSLIMVFFSVLGAADRIIGNRFGLGKEFEKGVMVIGSLALSMIGIPPTGGFFSKWYLVLGALQTEQYFFIAVLVLSCFLNAIYFFRVLENIFISKDAELTEITPMVRKDGKASRLELPLQMLIPIVVFGIVIIALGICNAQLVDIISLGLPEVL